MSKKILKSLFCSLTLVILFIGINKSYSQIASDNCGLAAANQMPVGSVCNPILFEINTALGAPAMTPCNGFTATGEDGWAWFTATSTTTTIDYTHYDRDAQIHIYSGSCAALTEIGCADVWGVPFILPNTETVTLPTVVGQNYYIRINRLTGTTGFMDGDLCVYSPPPLVNDDCANSIVLNCGDIVTGTTIGATADVIPGGCYIDNTSGGVWYSFTGTGLNVTASLCGSGFDTQIAYLTGTCGAFTCNTYNDDYCGLSSQVTLQTVLGTTYYIYVSGLFDAGDFILSLTCEGPPAPACFDTEPNGCPDIDLGLDISLPTCTIPCVPLNLTAQYFETGTTTSYAACSIPYAPYPYNTGTGFSIGVDDLWTGLIPLPFNFCFFGTNYSQCVVGSNGLISFNAAYASLGCAWAFTASCPNAALPRNSIFGVYHDIDPSIYCGAVPCGDARYATFGVAPCRVFVVSFDNVPLYDSPIFPAGCNALRTSCEIVLYETTNVIEVFIENKPTCISWNSGNALIGIQNTTGTVGFTPAGRNTGPWTATNEGWRFIPTGPSAVTINWSDQTGPLGTGTTLSVCPTDPTHTYVATATYARCDGSTVVVSDDVVVQCASFFVPVEWLTFDAEFIQNGQTVSCRWSTASELDNDYFTIQRSADGEHWQDVGIVDGSGSSQVVNKYFFNDPSPLRGLSYYRIQQTDFNGESKYSEVRSVQKENQLQLFPNPANDLLTVTPWKQSYYPKVYASSGTEVACSWSGSGQLDVSSLNPGSYFLEIHDKISGEINRFPVMISH